MAAASPTLPISNPQATTATPIAATSFRGLISQYAGTLRAGLSHRRPWAELFDRSAFSKPSSLSDASLRSRRNFSYFRINYLSVIFFVLLVSLLTHPVALLFLAALLSAWLFLYLLRPADPQLVILGRSFTQRETLGFLILSSLLVIFLTSVGSVLIYALIGGFAIVFVHGAFRIPEDLFLDDRELGSAGFVSFLTGFASSADASPAPAVAARI